MIAIAELADFFTRWIKKTHEDILHVVRKSINLGINKSVDDSRQTLKLLLEMILENPHITEAEISVRLTNMSSKSEQIKPRYIDNLKSKLFWLLVDDLIPFEPETIWRDVTFKKEYKLRQYILVMNILLSKGYTESPLMIAKALTREGKELAYADAVCEGYFCMVYYHSLRAGIELTKRFTKEYERWNNIRNCVKKAKLYQDEVNSWYANRWSLEKKRLKRMDMMIKELDMTRKEYNNPQIHEMYFRISMTKYEVQQSYTDIIQTALQAEEYYVQNPQFKRSQLLGGIFISAMSAYMWQEKFVSAQTYAEKTRDTIGKGTPVWFKFQELYLMLALRSSNFDLAVEIFRDTISHSLFIQTNELQLERWRLLEFYVRFISDVRFEETTFPKEDIKKSKSKFRYLNAFVHTNLPNLMQDRDGFRVSIVFAHILYLVSRADAEGIEVRDEALRMYRKNKLNKINYRLSIFSQMLHQLIVCDYDYEQVRDKTKNLYQQLSNIPKRYQGGVAESLEIIPLEKLWELILKQLLTWRCNAKHLAKYGDLLTPSQRQLARERQEEYG
jgi:hypothetical protein